MSTSLSFLTVSDREQEAELSYKDSRPTSSEQLLPVKACSLRVLQPFQISTPETNTETQRLMENIAHSTHSLLLLASVGSWAPHANAFSPTSKPLRS